MKTYSILDGLFGLSARTSRTKLPVEPARRRRTRRGALPTPVEGLESRALLTGNVVASLAGGDLVIRGDAGDNSVEVEVVDGDLVVRGLHGTTVNYDGSETVFDGVAFIPDDVRVHLGRGSDSLTIRDLQIGDDLRINTSGSYYRDDDRVTVVNTDVGDDLHVQTGFGDDAVVIDGVNVAADLSVRTHFGDDAVVLDSVNIGDDLRIDTGFGEDRVAVNNTHIEDRLRINTGFGDDVALIDQSFVEGRTDVRTGFGDDIVLLNGGSEFNGRVQLDGGFGDDTHGIDDATAFNSRIRIRRFEADDAEATLIRFAADEGLTVRNLPAMNPPGTGSTVFSLNGANFTGGEVSFAALKPFYATPPSSYILGTAGASISFDEPVNIAKFFFVHVPGDTVKTATAYDEYGNVVATVNSHAGTFLNDPNNFAVLAGSKPIARIVFSGSPGFNGGVIDNLSFI